MTAEQKIKQEIIRLAIENGDFNKDIPSYPDEVDEAYESLEESDLQWDYVYEYREGEVETDIPTDFNRHYEQTSVAAEMPDGTWVGWTYWYGGGKHGNPEEIEWMPYAYYLECEEKEETVVVRKFKKWQPS